MGGVSDESAEPQGVAGARAAGNDDRGGRRAGGDFVGVDADGDRGRIDVGVEIEEPGCDHLACDIDGLGRGRIVGRVDRCDPAIRHGERTGPVEVRRRVEQAAVPLNEVIDRVGQVRSIEFFRAAGEGSSSWSAGKFRPSARIGSSVTCSDSRRSMAASPIRPIGLLAATPSGGTS